jgi:hypothetical protein
MRTLQEKYNAIQQGKFSKEHFLAEARMQQPQLITRFNGYDDAVQILKNRGMIVEAKKEEGKKVTDHPFIVYTDKKGKHQLDEFNYEDDLKAFCKTIPNTWDVYETKKEATAELKRRLKENPEKFVKEAKLTKKSLTDYRYKPTNDMDKYPYEQILRGIRVELEALQVLGTPTAEEYSKALAKVSKNLEKDSIYYTNLVAGVNPKVDLHDKMVTATAKNTVDTFNGMKKAALKEGFKKLIKKVLSESSNDLADLFDNDEEREERRHNTSDSPENYKDEAEQEKPRFTFNDHGDFGDETDFGDEPEEREEEFELQGDDLDESRMGDVHILAQESNTLKDFLMAVKQQHPEVDIRRDIEELQDIWNNRQEDEIDYDDENFSDPFIDGEDDLFEGQKSLSELLK